LRLFSCTLSVIQVTPAIASLGILSHARKSYKFFDADGRTRSKTNTFWDRLPAFIVLKETENGYSGSTLTTSKDSVRTKFNAHRDVDTRGFHVAVSVTKPANLQTQIPDQYEPTASIRTVPRSLRRNLQTRRHARANHGHYRRREGG